MTKIEVTPISASYRIGHRLLLIISLLLIGCCFSSLGLIEILQIRSGQPHTVTINGRPATLSEIPFFLLFVVVGFTALAGGVIALLYYKNIKITLDSDGLTGLDYRLRVSRISINELSRGSLRVSYRNSFNTNLSGRYKVYEAEVGDRVVCWPEWAENGRELFEEVKKVADANAGMGNRVVGND